MAATQTTKKTKSTKPTAAQRTRLQRESERVAADLARVEETLGPSKSMAERLRSLDQDSVRARLRLQYQPWVVAGGVVILALIGQVGALAVGPAATAAGAGALIAAGVGLVRRAGGKSWWAEAGVWLRTHPARMVAVGAAAWCWTAASLLWGFAGAQVLATSGLWVLVGLSAHWWRTHRIGYQSLYTRRRDGLGAGEVADHYAQLWQEVLASGSGEFAGTTLSAHRTTTYGHAWDLKLRRGSRGLDALAQCTDQISTALGVAKKHISLSEHESEPDSPLRATLRITTASPTSGMVPIEAGADGMPHIMGRPVWDSQAGDICVGPYSDGIGMHTWGLYRANGIFGGYLFGAQNSGKSEMLNLLALGMRLSGCTTFWYLDGQGGTQPTLSEASDWDASSSAEERRLALEAAAITVMVRGLTNKAARAKGFTPTPARPGLVLVLDESHETIKNDYVRVPRPSQRDLDKGEALLDPGFGHYTNTELVDMITRIGRKVGVAVIAASQDTGLAAFGGSRVIRGNLFTANAGLMKSEDAISAQIAPKAALSPTELPAGGGYGAAANETGQDGGVAVRRAMWRAAYTEHFAELIEAAGPCLALEAEAAHYIDQLLDGVYARRHDVSAEERAEAAGQAIAAGLEGRLSAAEVLFGALETSEPVASAPASGAGGGGGGDISFATVDLDSFITEVEDHLHEAADPAPGAGAEQVPALLLQARAAITGVGDTRMHNHPLAQALGLGVEQMKEELRALGVRSRSRAFRRGGRELRGYALEDIDAAIAAHTRAPAA